ncbi:MAG: chorismate-binding protein [Vicinamibacteraceae bacterium]
MARFTSGDPSRPTWTPEGGSVELDTPRAVHVARRLEDVIAVVAEADRAAARGQWAAVVIAYDAAAAFEPAMAAAIHRDVAAAGLPLAWVAVFDEASVFHRPGPVPPHPSPHAAARVPAAAVAPAPWTPSLSRERFAAAIARVAAFIAAGDTYQVNYTFALEREGAGPIEPGDLDAWIDALCTAHAAGYGARIDLGDAVVLSASPELFVERRGDRLEARPMKGTSPRGRWLEEDLACRDALLGSEKAQAENVMIVDLLRNDLGRLAVTGSVRVAALFTAEAYPTVWQLTSSIEATLPAGSSTPLPPDQPNAPAAPVGIVDLMRALFPCGSVTGAPKIRTMEIISKLESEPRGVYTGAIGLVRPGGDAVFSVAIRTLVVDPETGEASLGIGAGIVADSKADEEYDECLLKGAFVDAQPLSGAPAVVRVPPAAHRDFEIIETVRVESGAWQHLIDHLDRMGASARYFRFPWDRAVVERAVREAPTPFGVSRGRIRLLVDGHVAVEVLPFAAYAATRRVALAPAPVDSSDPFLCHKTTRRDAYTRAQATRPDVDDVILWNTRGEITESTIANVVVELGGERWTSPRTCGLLPGVERGRLIDAGVVRERPIAVAELKAATRIWLVSALRGEVLATVVS